MGSSGGIAILWDKRVWKGELVEIGRQSLTGKFTGVSEDFSWNITAVYADCSREIRKVLWEELTAIRGRFVGPWIVCGDFNVTRYPSERTNCRRLSGAMTDFSSCIEELELIDPPLFGGSYTWRRGDNQTSASRIDRFLHCAQWGESFIHIKQNVLPKITSDHNPIMLTCGGWEWKKSYFKFESWWLEVEGFKDKVKEWWDSFNIEGRAGYILAEKMKLLKVKMKEWSKENKGNWRQRKEDILSQIANWEIIQEHKMLTDDEILQKANLAMEFEEIAKKEEIAWKQRSRVQWLKHGDKNTKFFHRIATSHKRFNTMEQLDIEGNIVKDPAMIKEAVQNFYINLYKEAEHWRPDLNIQDVNMITGEEQLWLQRPFEEEEILESIRMCAKEKAPRPDGFPMIFFETFWEVLKDIINTLSHFHSNQNFEKSFNATFIALIPKKAGASELKDYRPISLIGGVYKIIAKLLAERLKRVVSKLVNKNQMAFIKGRQIMDAALIASECIDSRMKGGVAGVLCKLDIQKAYDHVNWAFLLNVLRQMGFGSKWLKWIEVCIKTVKFSILVNGEPVGFFASERGLRQGDPLSPFLFILAMEGFDSMMRIATQNRWIKGFQIGDRIGNGKEISHLLYADDTIILCEPEAEQLNYIKLILILFEAVSGLKVN
ncbi:hypothetical protein MTR67_006984 [Solanum verrucosum]|uniref:Reverse transcriptase domain-containing protein n=2 Tax=Solanum verrucosum TaxID=315347 RepID=A0AAF0TCN8_SOLVR|nr:hypothetical protein MTR67_006984 [Solanum verrucosum]